jgi:hypothetical protein
MRSFVMAEFARHSNDSISVVGGSDLPDAMDPISSDDSCMPSADLDRRLYLLMKLHPDIDLNFRLDDLSAMDDSTKQVLIADIHSLLNVAPLKSTVL